MNELKCIRCLRTITEEEKEYNSISKGKVYPVLEYKNKLYRIKNDDDSTIFWYEEYLFEELIEQNNELNIIEASNMPYGTEFKVKIDCYYKYDDACRIRDNTKLIAVNTQSGIKFKEYVDIERASKSLINAKFIPLNNAVDFITAMNALSEGKTIENIERDQYKKIDGKIKVKHTLLSNEFREEGFMNLKNFNAEWCIVD